MIMQDSGYKILIATDIVEEGDERQPLTSQYRAYGQPWGPITPGQIGYPAGGFFCLFRRKLPPQGWNDWPLGAPDNSNCLAQVPRTE